MSTYRVGVFKVGQAIVDLHENRDGYSGKVFADPTSDPADRVAWAFDTLYGPACDVHDEHSLARSACSFGGYYTSDNRGDDLPPWAPTPDVADAIANASAWIEEPGQVEELDELPPWCCHLQVTRPHPQGDDDE